MAPDKPSENEDEYFVRQEFARRKATAEQKRMAMEERERGRLQELHAMHCPKCGMELIEIEFKSIKVDKCTGCEGVWLEKGELEVISEEAESDFLQSIFRVFR